MGGSPRTPSVVSRSCKPRPAGRSTRRLLYATLRCLAHRFAFSPSVPRVRGASEFLPASALPRHEVLRPPDGQDTRCVRSTSATQYELRVPTSRAFPAHSAAFAAWAPRGFWDPRGLTGGPGVFTLARTASAGQKDTGYWPRGPTRGVRLAERGHFLPTAPSLDRASDIPVAAPSSVPRSVRFRARVGA